MKANLLILLVAICACSWGSCLLQPDPVPDSVQPPEVLMDSLIFERPQETENDYPGFLSLYNNNSFHYFSAPFWNCLLITDMEGDWEIMGDTLNLTRHLEEFELEIKDIALFIDTGVQYRIDGNRLLLIKKDNSYYPGIMEPELISNTNVNEFLKGK